MKISDLNKIDIKDLQYIDYNQILGDLKKKPDVLIGIVAILATLIFSLYFYSNNNKNMKATRAELHIAKQKKDEIDLYNSIQKNFAEFEKSMIKKVSEDNFIKKITDIAVKRKIQILSYSPSSSNKHPLYQLSIISIDVSANTYKDMWLFIHDIEQSGENFRVDSWNGSLAGNSRNSRRRGRQERDQSSILEKSKINSHLEISSLTFKGLKKKDAEYKIKN